MRTRCSLDTWLLPEGGADRVASGEALVAFGGEADGVPDPDAAVPAAWEAAEGDPVGAESVTVTTWLSERIPHLPQRHPSR